MQTLSHTRGVGNKEISPSLPAHYWFFKSMPRSKRKIRRPKPRTLSAAISVPPVKSNTIRNLRTRWQYLNSVNVDVLGSDIAHWNNIVTIPGAFNAIPMYSCYRIKQIDVYSLAAAGSRIAGSWNTSLSAGGYMIPDPTVKASFTSSSGYSRTTMRPPKGSMVSGFFEPAQVAAGVVFSLDLAGQGYVEVTYDAAVRLGLPNDSAPGPGPVWIYGTATPASIGVTGTFASGPLAAAAAAVLAPTIGIMIY